MLIEAAAIQGKIKCLVCKKEFQVGSAKTQNEPRAEKKQQEPAETSSDSLEMIFCPRCEMSYAVPAKMAQGNQKKCPECSQML